MRKAADVLLAEGAATATVPLERTAPLLRASGEPAARRALQPLRMVSGQRVSP
jgi:hypothetical protein